jgi:aconitate hydratase
MLKAEDTVSAAEHIATFDGARIIDLRAAAHRWAGLERMPVSLRIILENLMRHQDGVSVSAADIEAVANLPFDWSREIEIAFRPSRVVMQDYAGMPALIDLAALRDKAGDAGLPPRSVNPQVPADLVVDHSLMVHFARSRDALERNLAREMADNAERFAFLKWAQQAFDGLRVVPPGQGIIHQINIEYLSQVVSRRTAGGVDWLFPDTVIGTDSHTTMVNGLGVLGWGVGGIEAEAVMLGEPVSMLVPPVIGVRLAGELPAGVLATDLVLSLTEVLRARGVVGAILEFTGPGVAALSLADRATIANMAPEFGATAAFFPTDERTLDYLRMTGRDAAQIARVEGYLKRNGLWYQPDFAPSVADTVDFDLSRVGLTVAGPSRPDERRALSDVPATIPADGAAAAGGALQNGDIVIAAITSCTITSNPAAMIAAGLLARNARRRGLQVPGRIKTSLAPGSRVVKDYLARAGLLDDLDALGFNIVGFGCTTCVGNSGDLAAEIADAIDAGELTVASVLSGNRNFEGRIHGKVRANYLMSPPMVVAYALAGTVRRDLTAEPLGTEADGTPVMLADIWPDPDEVQALMSSSIDRAQYIERYAHVLEGDAGWAALGGAEGDRFAWAEDSTYFRRPPFFDLPPVFAAGAPLLARARPLLMLGDFVTTDHISPVGAIAAGTPAAEYLERAGVAPRDFNAYGARRGDHEVMTRGTFANVRLRNEMATRTGGYTTLQPEGEETTVYAASRAYAARGEGCVVIAGQMYGAGSARDWAAKGTRLLGVSAVIAESFERIHRSNLVRMGVLPLQFAEAGGRQALGLGAGDTFSIETSINALTPGAALELVVHRADGGQARAPLRARVDTADELRYLRSGGILQSVAERILGAA